LLFEMRVADLAGKKPVVVIFAAALFGSWV
jgi:hypothetical protein